jgi:hypothetical protein
MLSYCSSESVAKEDKVNSKADEIVVQSHGQSREEEKNVRLERSSIYSPPGHNGNRRQGKYKLDS